MVRYHMWHLEPANAELHMQFVSHDKDTKEHSQRMTDEQSDRPNVDSETQNDGYLLIEHQSTRIQLNYLTTYFWPAFHTRIVSQSTHYGHTGASQSCHGSWMKWKYVKSLPSPNI
jgi:hypothetical protein